ncbi:MAG: BON domain-containing protein, partial [Candidatus Acidiferrum sp.]
PRTHRNTRFLLYPASESTRPKNFSLNRQVTILFSCVLSGIRPHHRNTNSNAHNIKIITQGRVTLYGPVRSEDEKNNLQAKAVAGKENVTNQFEIAPPK